MTAVNISLNDSDTCDKSWQHSQTGLIVMGFAASIMTFIFAAAAVVWVYVHQQSEELHRYDHNFFK